MPAQRFKNRKIYITGAGSGIGRATAQLLAAEGAHVFGVDVNADGVRETVDSIRQSGAIADGGSCDVADLESVRRSIGDALQRLGALHILINAAGTGRSVRLEEMDGAEWQRVIGVNLTGAFHTTKVALPHLLAQPGGCIVNIASTAALRGQAYGAHYAASKGALLNFTCSIALEFATRGLRANCICPGSVRSPFLRHFKPRGDFEQRLIDYIRTPVPGQFFAPEDAAKVIAFLASDDAHMINGAALRADGGTLA